MIEQNRGNSRNYCVYKHVNKINGKVYVGMTMDPDRRWANKGYEYKNSPRFNSAIQHYGWDSFKSYVLEDELTFEEACEIEIDCISKYQSTHPDKGYNLSQGGNGGLIYTEHPRGMLGKKQTQNQIENQKIFMSDRCNNPMSNGTVVFGKTHPHPLAKKVSVTTTEGITYLFDKIKDCADFYDIGREQMRRILHKPQPYQASKQGLRKPNYRKIHNYIFKFLDNPEVTKD